jgi:hypothetical protein
MQAAPAIDPNVFAHLRIMISMVLSLGIARLMTGLARFVAHPGRTPAWWVHTLWVVSTVLTLIHFWWWEFALAQLPAWRFGTYAFVVAFAALYFFLCAILFPEDIKEYTGYREYFLSRRAWFFGLLALAFVGDGADTLIKGVDYWQSRGIEYPLRLIAYVVLCVLAAVIRNARFHAAFAVVNLAYQVSWIVRQYDQLR